MKKIAIVLIITGLLVVFVSYTTPFNSGQAVFTKSIIVPQAGVQNTLEIPYLEQDRYEIFVQINSKKGVSKPNYKISIEDKSKHMVWSSKGTLYSEYNTKRNKLIKEALYGLGTVEIRESGRYSLSYQLFWTGHDGLIENLSFLIKKNTIFIPDFVVNTSLALALIGLFLLLFSVRKNHRIETAIHVQGK